MIHKVPRVRCILRMHFRDRNEPIFPVWVGFGSSWTRANKNSQSKLHFSILTVDMHVFRLRVGVNLVE
jgi:hypothetical protein